MANKINCIIKCLQLYTFENIIISSVKRIKCTLFLNILNVYYITDPRFTPQNVFA